MAQHDYIIANQSGASFRADLNNGLAAAVSQNSGAVEPSTTYAYMTWADTTTGLFKLRNGANSAWIPLYKLDGTGFSVANGTAAAPAVFFRDSGTDTGIYSSGTDAVDIATAGVRRVGVSSAGDVTIYGQGDLRLADSDSSNYVGLQAPSTVSSNVVFTLPSADGAARQSIVSDGATALSFANRSELVLATAVNSTSGTSIDFTGIPSWVKRVTVTFNDVSTNGTSYPIIQLGAGSFTTSGYSSVGTAATAATTVIVFSAGFGIASALAANTISGQYIFTNQTGNTWVGSAVLTVSSNLMLSSGRLNLSGTLDRVRITTVNGADTFDAGVINIMYEG